MSDEVSLSMRLGVLTVCTAGFLGSVAPLVFVGVGMLNQIGNKTVNVFNYSESGMLGGLVTSDHVSGPECYKVCEGSVGALDTVTVKLLNGTEEVVYDARNNVTDLVYLLTKYTSTYFRFKMDTGFAKGVYVITLEEVVR